MSIRSLLITFISCILALGSLTTIVATIAERDYYLRGYANPLEDANLPFRQPLFGVNAELTQYSPERLTQHLRWMTSAQVTWVRQFAYWNEIEPQEGQFHWNEWDQISNELEKHPSLRLVVVFMNSPSWAQRDAAKAVHSAPPADPADFGRFITAFTARYHKIVDYYQVWDEPNLAGAWGNNPPQPAEYAALLSEAYRSIRRQDDTAMVIAAGLAPTAENGPLNISDWAYLRTLYDLGANAFMDAAAAKPYGFDYSPYDRDIDLNRLNFSRLISLREEMVRRGDGHKALWAVAFGWNSLPPEWSGKPSIWGQVPSNIRDSFTVEALERANREWPWIGAMILQHWQPAVEADNPLWGFAIINRLDQHTPLWSHLTQRENLQAAHNGLYPADNPFTSYSGVWTFGDLGADIGWSNDSQLTFRFSGTGVSLFLRQGNYLAYLYPTIDGRSSSPLPRDVDGNPYIILKSDTLQSELNLVTVAKDLPQGNHVLHIVADRGNDQWALVGFAVSSDDQAAVFDKQIIVGVLGTLVSLVSLSISLIPFIRTVNLANRWDKVIGRASRPVEWLIAAITSCALMLGVLLTWGAGNPLIFRRDPIPLLMMIVTCGLIILQTSFAVTILSAIVLFLLIYNRLVIGLVLIIFWSPFFLFPIELYRFAFPMAELVLIITALAWVLRMLQAWGRKRQVMISEYESSIQERIQFVALDYCVLAWVICGIFSLVWTTYRDPALTDLRVMIIEPAIFYLMCRTLRLDRNKLIHLIDALLVAGALVSLIGLFLYSTGQVITAEGGTQRLSSVYGSPNNVALFLGRCIPFLIAYVWLPVSRLRRSLAIVGLILLGFAFILTQSAGGLFIGLPAGILVVIFVLSGKRRVLFTGIFAIALVAAFLVSLQFPRFARLVDLDSGTNFYRIRAWESAAQMIQDHPLTGLGMDQFLYFFQGRYMLPDAWEEPRLSHPHNIFLDFWVRFGVLGPILIVAFLYLFWKRAISLYRNGPFRDQPITIALLVGSMGAMANTIGHGLVDNGIFVQDLAYVFVMLLVIVNGVPQSIDEGYN